jgi:hypothetical protein
MGPEPIHMKKAEREVCGRGIAEARVSISLHGADSSAA